MSDSDPSTKATAGFNDVLESAVRLLVIGLLLLWCFAILKPFVTVVLWAVIIAVALHPIFLKLVGTLKGHRKLAAAVFTLVVLALVMVPTFMIAESLVDTGQELSAKLHEEDGLAVPPPPATVQSWPLIGQSVYETWSQASTNLDATLAKFKPQISAGARRMLSAMAGFGGAVLQSIFSIIIAGVLLATAEAGSSTARAIGKRLGGEEGVKMADTAGATIRSVAQGVVGVALVQGLLAGVGLFVMGIPAAGVWTVMVMILAVMQLPPLLILGPVAVYPFATGASTVGAVIFLVWCILVSASDGILKPLFLGRGVEIPMPVILLGAIGGMLLSGIIGLFVGAVVLAIGYNLFDMWMKGGAVEAREE